MIIKLPVDKIKFCLIGSGKVCVEFSKILIQNGFPKPIIVTWPKVSHKRDKLLLGNNPNYVDIFSFSKKNDITIIESKNINNNATLDLLEKYNVNILFSIKSRWIIKDYVIKKFDGNVINIHQGYLPFERGSVTYQKIMNGFKETGVTIHVVSPTIDTGDILYREKREITTNSPTIDIINDINFRISKKLLNEFVYDLKNMIEIKQIKQENDASIYMPQFFTEINGVINWDWDASSIEHFIRGFGPPMPGAFTFYKNKKIALLDSYIEKSNKHYHPYFYGRIVTIKDDGSIRIITKDDYLNVSKVRYGNFIGPPKEIIQMNSNAVFYSPIELLENSKKEFMPSLKMPPPPKEEKNN